MDKEYSAAMMAVVTRLQAFLSRILVFGLFSTLACNNAPPSAETADGALVLFVEAMERSQWEGDARKEAFFLLAEESQMALASRAKQATTLSGRPVEGWEILAEGRFRMSVDLLTCTLTFDEKAMVVDVFDSSKKRVARVPVKKEKDLYKLVLELPELPLRQP